MSQLTNVTLPGNLPYYPMLSREKYKATCTADRNLWLHFKIALAQPGIQGEIDRLKQGKDIDHPFGQWKLTPLHIAVIADRIEDVEALLLAGAKIETSDCIGNTALHHAAMLKDDTILKRLVQKVGDVAAEKFRNKYGANYKDVQQLLNPRPIDPGQVVCQAFDETTSKVVPKTATEFEEMTGARFLGGTGFVVNRAALIEEILNPVKTASLHRTELRILDEHLRKQLVGFRDHPEWFYLKKEPVIGCDVYTERDFKAGDLLFVYGGEQFNEPPESAKEEKELERPAADNTHTYEGTSALRQRSAYGWAVNDGACPNTAFHSIPCQNGLRKITLMYATDDLKPNTRLLAHYGDNHPVKRTSHIELNRQGLVDWICGNGKSLKGPLEQAHLSIEKPSNNPRMIAKHVGLLNKLHYLFDTLNSLMDLIFSGLLDPQETLQLMETPYFKKIFGMTSAENLDVWRSCIETTCSITKFLQQAPVPLRNKMRGFLLHSSRHMYSPALLVILPFIETEIQEGAIKTIEDWEKLESKYIQIGACCGKVEDHMNELILKLFAAKDKTRAITQEDVFEFCRIVLQSGTSSETQSFLLKGWLPARIRSFGAPYLPIVEAFDKMIEGVRKTKITQFYS